MELLETYSLSDIVIFTCMLAVAIKGFFAVFDWGKERLQKVFDKGYDEKERAEKIDSQLGDNTAQIESINQSLMDMDAKIDKLVDVMNRRIDMLVESDKESIKAYITEKHHYFVYDKKWIDDYNLECLSKRFAVYQEEHGNSFIEGLMDEIADLPKRPPTEDDVVKFENTEKYVKRKKNV